MSIFGGGQGPAMPDPALKMQRDQQEARANLAAEKEAMESTQAAMGRTMGKRGARAFFTGTGAGFTRTLGGANLGAS